MFKNVSIKELPTKFITISKITHLFKEAMHHTIVHYFCLVAISVFTAYYLNYISILLQKLAYLFEKLETTEKNLIKGSNIFEILIPGIKLFIVTFIILAIKQKYEYFKTIKKMANIAIAADFKAYFANRDVDKINQAESDLKKVALNSKVICILGGSGFRTFGNKTSPLYQEIIDCSKLYVLMLHPVGTGIEQRVKSLLHKNNPDYSNKEYKKALLKYQNEIASSIRTLNKINGLKSDKVFIAFYDELPTFKLIIIDRKLIWIQYYTQGIHVRELPAFYIVGESESTSVFLNGFCDTFDNQYKISSKDYIYNFNTGSIISIKEGKTIKFPKR
jgi:hypothetical protein